MSNDSVNFEEESLSEDSSITDSPISPSGEIDECFTAEISINTDKARLISETQTILKKYQGKFVDILKSISKIDININDVENGILIKAHLKQQEEVFKNVRDQYVNYYEKMHQIIIIDDLRLSKTMSLHTVPTINLDVDTIDHIIVKIISTFELLETKLYNMKNINYHTYFTNKKSKVEASHSLLVNHVIPAPAQFAMPNLVYIPLPNEDDDYADMPELEDVD